MIPTRNEADSVATLLERLENTVHGPTQVVFVDDSDDTTAFRVKELAERFQSDHLEITLVHRTDRLRDGGLGTAVCDGLRRARGTWVCVLDADLQHPPELVCELVDRAEEDDVDIVVASRYAPGGSERALTPSRRAVSKACSLAARSLFPLRMRKVRDPLSGFFLMRRAAVNPDDLRPHGFKILLEVLGRNPHLSVAEVGYEFSERYGGVSKASIKEGFRYAWQLGHVRATGGRRGLMKRQEVWYDIHGILSISSEMMLPELKEFRVRHPIDEPDIRVTLKRFDRRQRGEFIDLDDAQPHVLYHESTGGLGFMAEITNGPQVRAKVSPMIAKSPHVLYTNVVEPILRWKFVERGWALVHAAAFAHGDDAYLITARTDTGKTTTMLKVLERLPVSFLSDDLVLVDAAGQVLTYPKPLTISNHTVAALGDTDLNRVERFFLPVQSRLHSRMGRQIGFNLAGRKLPVATMNAVVQRLIPPPKYRVDKLVPGVGRASSAHLRELFVIQRGDDFERALPTDEAVGLLLENCEDAYGFPPYDTVEGVMLASSQDDLRTAERAIVTAAFDQLPATLLSSSRMGWAEQVRKLLEQRRARRNGATPMTAAAPAQTPARTMS